MAIFFQQFPITKRPSSQQYPTICKTKSTEISHTFPQPLPKPLHTTTIYHLLPCTPAHHAPTSHPSDEDTLLLALSPNTTTWLRTRYIRTKAFLQESRLRKRIYHGLHGTPTVRDINIFTKPKSVPNTLVYLPKKLFAAGRGLPWNISPRDLVTFGQTAIGDVLTYGPLIHQRGTEIAAVSRYHGNHSLLTVAKNTSGNILRSFMVQHHVHAFVLKIDAFPGKEIALFNDGAVLVGWQHALVTDVGRLLHGLFGVRGESSVDKFCEICVVRSRKIVWRGKVEGILMNVHVEDVDGDVTIMGKRIVGEGVTLTTLEDIRSGAAFVNGGIDVKSSLVRFSISDRGVGEIVDIGDDHIAVMDVAKVYDMKNRGTVYIGYNGITKQIGLYDLDGGCWEPHNGILSAALYHPHHTYISVIHTLPEADPKMLFFETGAIPAGPIAEVPLTGLAGVHPSIDGIWTDLNFEWSEDTAKIVKSAYEVFFEKEWNDIESGFSSLGF